MKYWLWMLILSLNLTLNKCATSCPGLCSTCELSTPYSCITCISHQANNTVHRYLWSCQQIVTTNNMFLVLCICIVIVHLFMLIIGIGVYSTIYSQIQIISLLLWVDVGEWRAGVLQATGFGIMVGNNFVKSYAFQLVVIIFILVLFWFVMMGTINTPNHSVGILIRRKRIIFPLRIITLTFNTLLFSSMASLSTQNQNIKINFLQLFLSILGLLTSIAMFLGLIVICNYKTIKLDDPCFYPICQSMVSSRWWVRNSIVFQYSCFMSILLSFTLGFKQPSFTSIPILTFQTLYTIYSLLFLPFTKLRYKIALTLANLLFFTVLLLLNFMTNGFHTNYIFSVLYTIFIICLCALFIAVCGLEIVVQRHRIGRIIRSFWRRLCCGVDDNDKQYMTNPYDTDSVQQKVVKFQDNLIYGIDLGELRCKLRQGKAAFQDQIN